MDETTLALKFVNRSVNHYDGLDVGTIINELMESFKLSKQGILYVIYMSKLKLTVVDLENLSKWALTDTKYRFPATKPVFSLTTLANSNRVAP